MAREQIPNYIARKSKWTAMFKTGGIFFWPMFAVFVILTLVHLSTFSHPFKILGMGHTAYEIEKVDSTCTEEGHKAYYICWKCDKLYSDKKLTKEITKEDTVIKKKDHTLVHNEAVDSTYENDGCVEHWACTTCYNTFADKDAKTELDVVAIPKLSHADDNGHVHNLTKKTEKVENACGGAKNVTYFACDGCDKIYFDNLGEKEFDRFAHTPEFVEATESTCTERGTVEHYKCTTCKKLFSDAACTNELTEADINLGYGHTLHHGVAVGATYEGYKDIYFCMECDKMHTMFATEDGEINIERPYTVVLFKIRFCLWTLIIGAYALLCLILYVCALIRIKCHYVEFYDTYVIQRRGVFWKRSKKCVFPHTTRVSVRRHFFNYGDIQVDVIGPCAWDVDLTGYARPDDVRDYLVDHMIDPATVESISSNPYIAALGVCPDNIF